MRKMTNPKAVSNGPKWKAWREIRDGRDTIIAGQEEVDHPRHYTTHPSGVECIQITEHFNFCLGNAIKYIWRASKKGDFLEDLKKARWYLDREISRFEKKHGI